MTVLSDFNLHDSVWEIIPTEGVRTLQVAPWHEVQWVQLDLVPQLLLHSLQPDLWPLRTPPLQLRFLTSLTDPS